MDDLLGRIEDMVSSLCIGSDDVWIVGIWGMAGIGKTTVAKVVYNRIHNKYEDCYFLKIDREDSQRHDLTYLKEKLLSQSLGGKTKIFDTRINFIKARLHSRRVLIVLDDVHTQQQLQALAGDHDWFG